MASIEPAFDTTFNATTPAAVNRLLDAFDFGFILEASVELVAETLARVIAGASESEDKLPEIKEKLRAKIDALSTQDVPLLTETALREAYFHAYITTHTLSEVNALADLHEKFPNLHKNEPQFNKILSAGLDKTSDKFLELHSAALNELLHSYL